MGRNGVEEGAHGVLGSPQSMEDAMLTLVLPEDERACTSCRRLKLEGRHTTIDHAEEVLIDLARRLTGEVPTNERPYPSKETCRKARGLIRALKCVRIEYKAGEKRTRALSKRLEIRECCARCLEKTHPKFLMYSDAE